MAKETILTNAQLILEDQILSGSILVRDGVIADIWEGKARTGEDMEGDFLVPGLVELHTDHLEGHYAPRPKVRWNPLAAVLAHDAQIAASGITTVFDALRVGTIDSDGDINADDMIKLADAIDDSVNNRRMRADHLLHLRCEVSAADCVEAFDRFGRHGRVRLASLMDHAPGQRQFAQLDAYRTYYQGKLKMSDEAFSRFCQDRMAASTTYSAKHRTVIAGRATERGIVLASHDDATVEHVDEAVGQGVRVAEFPTTLEAARASHDSGMAVLMGAPNVVRGGSHSGNVSARMLAKDGCLDILSSDYIPYSLVQSAFHLGEVVDGVSLPDAINMVSRNPARAVGLDDRGSIEIGKRGDLVRVSVADHIPVVRTVWREGRRVV